MKLATFRTDPTADRIGALLGLAGGDRLIDLHAANARFQPRVALAADMLGLIRGGEAALQPVRDLLDLCAKEAAMKGAGALADVSFAPDRVTFLPPLPNPGKIVSVGANYPSHVEEISDNQTDKSVAEIGKNLGSGEYPPAFAKMGSSLTGHDSDVPYPSFTEKMDYEAELAFVIGRDPRTLPEGDWRGAIAGYMNSNDLSARDVQFREMKRGLLLLGKNFPGACPTGPWLVTDDEIDDPMALTIQCRVNGDIRQNESTARMIFDIASIIAHYRDLPLLPGDVVTTGSPAGVAIGMKESEKYFLRPGDTVEVEISGLGVLRSRIV